MLPLEPRALLKVVREVRAQADAAGHLVVGGAAPAARELAARLGAGGAEGALRDASGRALGDHDLAGAAALVYVLDEAPTAADEASLRLATRGRVPVVCVATRAPGAVPYVLAADVVPAAPGGAASLDEVARRLTGAAEESAPALAARLPALRQAVGAAIVGRISVKNAILGGAARAAFPALALAQARMLLRLAVAHGLRIDRGRAVELAALVGVGLGARGLARRAAVLPGPDWAYRALVSYAATRAIGEAARARFSESVRSGS